MILSSKNSRIRIDCWRRLGKTHTETIAPEVHQSIVRWIIWAREALAPSWASSKSPSTWSFRCWTMHSEGMQSLHRTYLRAKSAMEVVQSPSERRCTTHWSSSGKMCWRKASRDRHTYHFKTVTTMSTSIGSSDRAVIQWIPSLLPAIEYRILSRVLNGVKTWCRRIVRVATVNHRSHRGWLACERAHR